MRDSETAQYPARALEAALPEGGFEFVHTHHATAAGRMQKTPIADVDACMVHPPAIHRKQHQITRRERVFRGLDTFML